jgi:hypothetical protein
MGIFQMKTVAKLLMGATVLAAAANANAALTTAPSTDSSNLLFFVSDLSTHTTYTTVLTQLVGTGSGAVFNSAQANTPGAVTGVVNNPGTTVGSFSYNYAADAPLQTFLGSGDTFEWGLIGGATTGTNPITLDTVGNSLAVLSSIDATSPVQVSEGGIDGGGQSGLASDVKVLNLKTLAAGSAFTKTGVFGTSFSHSTTNINFYGTGVDQAGAAIGTTAIGVYGLTGNGTGSGQALVFNLGTATFNGTLLQFTGASGGSTVPLPAAAWLFGSGLLGLLGIGRRRDSAAVAA